MPGNSKLNIGRCILTDLWPRTWIPASYDFFFDHGVHFAINSLLHEFTDRQLATDFARIMTSMIPKHSLDFRL